MVVVEVQDSLFAVVSGHLRETVEGKHVVGIFEAFFRQIVAPDSINPLLDKFLGSFSHWNGCFCKYLGMQLSITKNIYILLG